SADGHGASVDMAYGMRGHASEHTSEAGGSVTPAVDDSVRGHLYDLRMERNSPDRFTPSWFGQGMMGKGLNWLVRKK
ncbi:hypothetical protein HN873_016736, partial [Arachis hypogaea]